MKTSRILTVLALAMVTGACDDPLGPDLTGLWIAGSYVYRSGDGQEVDLVQRDGASLSLTVSRMVDGSRQVSILFNDGTSGPEPMTGSVDVDAGTFTFGGAVYQFVRTDDELRLTDQAATFDFGGGEEAATLTIRLTQL